MSNDKVRIGGIVDLSTVDWPFNLCSVVFFSGCNFRCPYCQNAKLVDPSYGKLVDVDEVVKEVSRNKGLIDGVVISGGECTLQLDALIKLSRSLKGSNLKVGIDTNGSTPEAVEELIKEGLLDRVALDVKAPLNPEIYGKVIGLPQSGDEVVRRVEKTISALLKAGIEVEVRVLVVPGLMDGLDNVRRIARTVKYATRLVIQQFRPEADLLDGGLKSLKPHSRVELIAKARAALSEGVKNVYVRTREGGLEKVGRG
ncbi:MAG: anaerobic ribonucleoside-triphosphate reductase activating protein [Candidatus Nezhaarchaeota archaeon]|nr:anaerobic ribonucleoside-triphosphate reductase activating protein [Candidatus Nezhaarchaeota archaeon]